MGTVSCPSCSTSSPATCLRPEKTEDDGPIPWAHIPIRETQKKLLTPGSSLVIVTILGVNQRMEDLFHNKSAFPIKTNKL